MRIPVLTRSAAYAAAIAELPSSLMHAQDARGGVVVVDDANGAEAAVEAGAIGLVILAAPAAVSDELREIARSVPTAIARPRLRPDVAEAARAAVGAQGCLVLDAVCAKDEQAAVAADALGWARSLLGGPLRVRAADRTGGGVLALLDGPRAEPVSLLLSISAPRGRGASIWAEVVGESLVRVVIDGSSMPVIDAATARAGLTQPPPLWETGERLVLRRLVDALRAGRGMHDVSDLEADLSAFEVLERIAGPSAR